MLLRLLLLFTLVPLAELVLLLVLADATTWEFTLALVLVTGMLGAWLARREGLRCWRRVDEEIAAGRLPGDPLIDGLMILLAGALLVTPGILTDLVGFLLLIPPARRLLKNRLRRRFQARIHIVPPTAGWAGPDRAGSGSPDGPPPTDRIVETRVIDVPLDDA